MDRDQGLASLCCFVVRQTDMPLKRLVLSQRQSRHDLSLLFAMQLYLPL